MTMMMTIDDDDDDDDDDKFRFEQFRTAQATTVPIHLHQCTSCLRVECSQESSRSTRRPVVQDRPIAVLDEDGFKRMMTSPSMVDLLVTSSPMPRFEQFRTAQATTAPIR